MTNRKTKHKRAIKGLLIASLCCAIPLGFLYYVTENYSERVHEKNIEPPPFMMEQTNNGYFTNQSLLGKVTYLLYLPESCRDCAKFLSENIKVNAWSSKALKKQDYFEESDVDLQKFLLTSRDSIHTLFADWIHIKESPESHSDVNHFASVCGIDKGAATFIFNRYGNLKACIPADQFFYKNTRRTLSKVMFHTAMDEYLSERTFFGPRK